jgi:hypothetical protein
MRNVRNHRRLVALACAASLCASGCAGSQDDAATRAALRLLDAAAAGDGAAACAAPTRDELEQSSGKPCEEAVLEEELDGASDADRVDVFNSMARVAAGSQTVFLSRYDGRWKVVAAACTSVPDRPYDCSIGLP